MSEAHKKARQKGKLYQDWIKKWLMERGFHVHDQPTASKLIRIKDKLTGEYKVMYVSVRNDIFGIIDLIAKKSDTKTLWIQATMNTSMKKKKEKLVAIPWNFETDCVQFWIKRSPGKTDIFELRDDGIFFELVGKILNRHYYSLFQSDIFWGKDEIFPT
jgi:hypothetical protein